jgi:hypothetical protein
MRLFDDERLVVKFDGVISSDLGKVRLEVDGDDLFDPRKDTLKVIFERFGKYDEMVFAALTPGTFGELVWFPFGNCVGNPVLKANALVYKRKRGLKIMDSVMVSAEFTLCLDDSGIDADMVIE